MDLASWLRVQMTTRRIKNKQLGEHMGWDSGSTTRKLSGERPLSAEELFRITEFLGYDLPAFLKGEAPRTQAATPTAISDLAEGIDEAQQQALLVYLKLLPKKG